MLVELQPPRRHSSQPPRRLSEKERPRRKRVRSELRNEPNLQSGQLAERGHAENEQPDQGTPARSHQLLLNSSTSVRAQATQVFTNLLFAVSGHRPIA